MKHKLKLNKPQKRPIENGAKFGKLEITTFWDSHNDRVCFCRCECGQSVSATGAALQDGLKTQCLNCDERSLADNFRDGDVVIVLKTNYAAIENQEAIIAGRSIVDKQIYLNLEFCGRIYKSRPSQLENTGVNFYDKR